MQATERAEKCRFLTFDHDLQSRPSEGPTRLPCEFGAIRSAVPEIFHTQTKKTD